MIDMNREVIFEKVEDTQIANLIVLWHEAENDYDKNEIFYTLYAQEGIDLGDLFALDVVFKF